jgi:hypothetical protein
MAKESAKKRTVTAGNGSRPYPCDYSLRVFYGPGLNPAIDQALFKIVGRTSDSSGCFTIGRRERDLEWNFGAKRRALAAANRIVNRVTVPGGRLLLPRERSQPIVTLGSAAQKIHRVEVWEEAPRRILNVGFQARRGHGA